MGKWMEILTPKQHYVDVLVKTVGISQKDAEEIVDDRYERKILQPIKEVICQYGYDINKIKAIENTEYRVFEWVGNGFRSEYKPEVWRVKGSFKWAENDCDEELQERKKRIWEEEKAWRNRTPSYEEFCANFVPMGKKKSEPEYVVVVW